jgi:hypothetical protein
VSLPRQSDVLNLMLVQRHWYPIAHRLLDRFEITISADPVERHRMKRLASLLADASPLQSRIRHIVVRGWFDKADVGSAHHRRKTWPQIVWLKAIVAKLNLWTFTYELCFHSSTSPRANERRWACGRQIPNVVLSALKSQNACNLEIQPSLVPGSECMSWSDPLVSYPAFSTAGCLAGLGGLAACISCLDVRLEDSNLLILRDLIVSAEHLKTLRTFFEAAWPGYRYLGEATKELTQFEPGQPIAFPQVSELHLKNLCLTPHDQNWHYWRHCIQWPHLRDVGLTCSSFLFNAAPYLSQINRLWFRFDQGNDTMRGYCGCRPGIESVRTALLALKHLHDLELINAAKAVDAELVRHLGKTVKRLRICEEYAPRTMLWAAQAQGNAGLFYEHTATHLSDEVLREIGRSCPLLRNLEIDAPSKCREVGLLEFTFSRHTWTCSNIVSGRLDLAVLRLRRPEHHICAESQPFFRGKRQAST